MVQIESEMEEKRKRLGCDMKFGKMEKSEKPQKINSLHNVRIGTKHKKY